MSPILVAISLYLFLAAGFTAYYATYSLIRKESRLARYIAIFCALISVYLLGYVFELNSTTEVQMRFWNLIQYFAIPFYPACWLLIAHEFVFRGRRKMPANPLWLFLVPFLSFVVRITNEWHHLLYTNIEVVNNGFFFVQVLSKGPFYYIQSAYFLLMIIIAGIGYLQLARQSDPEIRFLTTRLVIISLLPWLGFLPMVIPTIDLGIDFIALILPLSAFLFASVIHNHNFFPLRSRAMEESFNSNQQGIVLFDQKNVLVDANPFALEIFPDLKKFLDHPLPHFTNRSPFYGCLTSKNGKNDFEVCGRTFYFHASPILDKKGKSIGTLGIFVDITERVTMTKELLESKREIAHLVYHDPLTNLYNRRYLSELLQTSVPEQYPMGLIFLDFNELKHVNDVQGHLHGDEVLCEVARILMEQIRPEDYALRVGGDEFMVLKPHTTQEELIRFLQQIEAICAQQPEISFSMGYALMEDAKDYNRAFKEAEDRMYVQKRKRAKT